MAGKRLKVAVAGLGRSGYAIHTRWLREAPEQFEIVAACDGNAKYRSEMKKEFGCKVYKDHKEMIKKHKDEIDLFVNAMVSTLHPKVSIDALNAGLNTVCEKPAAVKVKDFDQVVAAAKKSGKLYAPFQNSRFFPYFQKALEIIESGVLGDLVHVRLNWSGFARRWDWQTRQDQWGGNLNNTGPHPLDQALVLFGKKTPKVFCQMKSEAGSFGDAEDFAAVTLYGQGSPVTEVVTSSYQAYPLGKQIDLCGTHGCLTGSADEMKWKYYDPKKAPKQSLWPMWSKDRGYCGEKLPWVKEKTWKADMSDGLDHFQRNSKLFYNNIYDVLVNKGKLIVTPAQVRRQVAVLEECHRQNPLPKMKKKR